METVESREEWLRLRQEGIGSSDAPIIMGVSPWATVLDLYEQKVAPFIAEDTSNQYAKDIGNEAEPKIRSLFELVAEESFAPALMQSDKFSFLRASLDGISKCRKKILEIKISGKDDWTASKEKKKVPDKYWPQVQHALLASGAEVCFYVSYLYSAYKEDRRNLSFKNLAIIEVLPDKEYQGLLLEKETEFWSYVTKRKPPIPDEKDYSSLNGVSEKLKEYKKLSDEINELSKKLDSVKSDILKVADETGKTRYVAGGFRIRKESRVGNVIYKNIPELKGVDLDKYRGSGSVFWKIEEIKEKKKVKK